MFPHIHHKHRLESRNISGGDAGYSELTRRLGFEYNGVVLHEYYFGNMTKGGTGDPGKQSVFYKAAEAGFGSYIWKSRLCQHRQNARYGWAICFQDPKRGPRRVEMPLQ